MFAATLTETAAMQSVMTERAITKGLSNRAKISTTSQIGSPNATCDPDVTVMLANANSANVPGSP